MSATDPRPDEKWKARTRECYELLIGPLREVARGQGYALGVHGSLERDIDLIAVPWQQTVGEPVCLAEAIRKKAEEITGQAFMDPHVSGWFFVAGCPGARSHGRLCWTFHLGGGPYIDLSVFPPTRTP